MSPTTYKDAGVDITLGDEASKILYEAARQTWENRASKLGEVISPFDDFSGVRAIDIGGLPKGTILGMGFDGVGTKVEIAERMNKHDTIAFDLLAMVCDDAVVRGAEPVLAGSVLDIDSLGETGNDNLSAIKELARGYVNAAQEAGVAIINGELAELGPRINGYGRFHYSWSSGVIWFARRERMFSGFEVEPGDTLVGFWEEGFRSNGLSLVRRILTKEYGDDWHRETRNGHKFGDRVLRPSRIYTRAVIAMIGGVLEKPQVPIHGVAHITGGGIPGKLGRMLKPKNLGAHIEDPFTPDDFVIFCQKLGEVTDEEAYQTWNMGQGMVVATPEPDHVIALAGTFDIEAKAIGTVTPEPGISLKSYGAFNTENILMF